MPPVWHRHLRQRTPRPFASPTSTTARPASATKFAFAAWVRTRRDSKAGLSFIHILDGSSARSVPRSSRRRISPNYEADISSEVSHRAARSDAKGELVESQGKGQSMELQASTRSEVVGWVDDPESYPMQAKRHTHGVPARGSPPCGRAPIIIGAVTRVRHHTRPRQSIASSTTTASIGFTRRSSPRPIAKARARCFGCRRSTWSTRRERKRAVPSTFPKTFLAAKRT